MKKALILLLVITVIAKLSFSQKQGQERIDSLLTVLETAQEDTSKVKTLNALAKEYYNNNPDTTIYFASEALILAINLNYKMGMADAQSAIGIGLRILGKYEEALKNLNDALKLYNELLPSSMQAFQSKIQKGISICYNNIGRVNVYQGNYPEGLNNFFNSLSILQKMGDKRGMAIIYNGIGGVYFGIGNYPEALKNYLASLKFAEEIGDESILAELYNNIGITYDQQGNYTEALKNYFAALKIDEKLGNNRGRNMTLMNIGINYEEQGNHEEALNNYFAALKLSEELGDKEGKAMNLNNIGLVYFDQGNYAEALKNHLASLKIAEEIGDKDLMTNCNNIGNDYIKLKKYSEASRYLNRGLSIAKEIGNLKDIKESYLGLTALDSAQGNFKKSLENYKMYITYRDSLVNDENTKKIVQIQMQYEFDKKESLAKAEQDKKDALALEALQKQKLLRNGLIGGFLALLILAAVFSIILIQRREIRLIKKERNRISRELHDDIGAELNRITVISHLLQKKTSKDEEMQGKLMKISEAGKKVLGSIGEIIWTMNPQKDNLESLVSYIRRFVTEYLETNGIEVNIEFPDEIPSKSVSDEFRRNIFLVVKEVIYNITKYSKASNVKLSMQLRNKMAEFEISDNGTGFSVEEKQNWGNGLRNMNQRMKDIRGDFQISSEKNVGTFIKLIFPIH